MQEEVKQEMLPSQRSSNQEDDSPEEEETKGTSLCKTEPSAEDNTNSRYMLEAYHAHMA